MSNIIINGETYENIETISANTPDGGIATFLSEENISTKQDKIDESLNTESKEIVGAINELKENIDNIEVPEGGGSVDLTEYVKFTDVATNSKPGLVSYSSKYGMQLIGNALAPLNWDTYITNRTPAFMSYALLDKVVKAGVTTNTQTLTDEEKVLAQNWLGVSLYQHNFYLYNKIVMSDGEGEETAFKNFKYRFSVISKYSQPFTLQTLLEKCAGITMFGYSGEYFESDMMSHDVQAYIDGNNILLVRVPIASYEAYGYVNIEHHNILEDNSAENYIDHWEIEDIVQEIL